MNRRQLLSVLGGCLGYSVVVNVADGAPLASPVSPTRPPSREEISKALDLVAPPKSDHSLEGEPHMTLVDTSVWVDHFRRDDARLAEMLMDGRVMTHSFVIGEIACADFKNRNRSRAFMTALPQVEEPEHGEVLEFVDREKLFGRGIGWVDVVLLAACRLTGCDLWTLDKRLQVAAIDLGIQSREQKP